ncbi:hypothetical protein [Pararhizobium sp. DWP1-1-3]|uniref:hypothetical protein n=1 Tax=Pararhizobium sp. DWP1-1-3 TaxID=2804652 RepID=UPI003CF9F4B9
MGSNPTSSAKNIANALDLNGIRRGNARVTIVEHAVGNRIWELLFRRMLNA